MGKGRGEHKTKGENGHNPICPLVQLLYRPIRVRSSYSNSGYVFIGHRGVAPEGIILDYAHFPPLFTRVIYTGTSWCLIINTLHQHDDMFAGRKSNVFDSTAMENLF